MVSAEEPHAVEGCGAKVDLSEFLVGAHGVVERGEERCVGEGTNEIEDHSFRSATLGQVIVGERHRWSISRHRALGASSGGYPT